jgi:hypothetical protein
MAIAITMKQAFDQALEEITNFHLDPQHDGFPRELTHHINRESPRRLSHGVDFVDHGNWAGSVLMYAMLFEVGPELSLLRILDQTGLRWHVYRYWGAEGQTSGKGPDNDRTNLLESMLSLMGPEKSASTERAWDFVRRYWLRHPKLTRQELLEQALSDPSVNIYTDDDAIAEQIMTGMCTETGDDKDPAKADMLKLLFPFVRQRARTPDHYDIRRITGSSPKNIPLLQWLWEASDLFRISYMAEQPACVLSAAAKRRRVDAAQVEAAEWLDYETHSESCATDTDSDAESTWGSEKSDVTISSTDSEDWTSEER